jgi:hypothetical protein
VLLLAALWLGAAGGEALSAGETPPLEYQVKAACLVSFLKFVEWPVPNPEPGGTLPPLVIAVLGDDPFGAALDELARGKKIDGREVKVVRWADAGAAAACHILFVSSDDKRTVNAAVEAARASGALTVGERAEFLRAGGMVRFVIEAEKVRFEIDQQGAEKGGVKISAKLFQLARKVYRGDGDRP